MVKSICISMVDGKADKPELLKAAQGYVEGEFGDRAPNLSKLPKLWVVVETDGESVRVIGVTAMRYCLDVPLFHSQSSKAYALMFNRLANWAEDNGINRGMVYIKPSNYRTVKDMVRRIKGEPAHRWKFSLGG